MNSPTATWSKLFLAFAITGSLAACSPTSNGPTSSGASHGSLAGSNASEYYYKKDAGWVYAYSNVVRIANSTGTMTAYNGANDTVTTLGATGITAPSGDPMYAVSIKYRVLSTYAGHGTMDVTYVAGSGSTPGAFVDGNASIPNVMHVNKSPRPVSTDTILAGVAGRIRSTCDDFTNGGSTTWQTDTLYFTATANTVSIWEHPTTSPTSWIQSRQIFGNDLTQNASWNYDMIDGSTIDQMQDPDVSVTTTYGTYAHSARVGVSTPSSIETLPITEQKWFALGTGVVLQKDHWYVTTDGSNRTEEDFTRSLITLTHQ